MRRAVFLDRDGVLDRAIVRAGRPCSPATPAELEILPGVADACDALEQGGFVLAVVTNQPDVARGKQSRGPGLLLEAARDLGIDLAASFMVGDRSKDVEAGRRAGCRAVLIECGYLLDPGAAMTLLDGRRS